MQARVAIIGSCVTRDVWRPSTLSPEARAAVFMLARTSLASLFTEPDAAFSPPEEIPAGLSGFEVRMVSHDILKTGLLSLVRHRPTHVVVDFVDERFDLIRRGDAVATLSWEAHLLGVPERRLLGAERIARASPEALQLWRLGLRAFKRFLEAELPGVRLILHDAPCATEYVDDLGRRCAFGPDWEFWPGVATSIRGRNELFGRYVAEFRAALPHADYLRAPAELAVASARRRWGLAPFHYIDDYYHYIGGELERLGCRLSPRLNRRR